MLYFVILKIIMSLCAVAFAYMGYRLFTAGILKGGAQTEVSFGEGKGWGFAARLARGGPGLVFALFGMVMFVVAVLGGSIEETREVHEQAWDGDAPTDAPTEAPTASADGSKAEDADAGGVLSIRVEGDDGSAPRHIRFTREFVSMRSNTSTMVRMSDEIDFGIVYDIGYEIECVRCDGPSLNEGSVVLANWDDRRVGGSPPRSKALVGDRWRGRDDHLNVLG